MEHPNSNLYYLAIEALLNRQSEISHELGLERHLAQPDSKRISALKGEATQVFLDRNDLLIGDRKMLERVIRKYVQSSRAEAIIAEY